MFNLFMIWDIVMIRRFWVRSHFWLNPGEFKNSNSEGGYVTYDVGNLWSSLKFKILSSRFQIILEKYVSAYCTVIFAVSILAIRHILTL